MQRAAWEGSAGLLQQSRCVAPYSLPVLLLCLQGVANRDIKLENTLLDGTTRPLIKICDFGYSKVGTSEYAPPIALQSPEAGWPQQHAGSMATRRLDLTVPSVLQHEKFQSAPGSRVGTPAYLAPEVILTTKGKTYDGKVRAARLHTGSHSGRAVGCHRAESVAVLSDSGDWEVAGHAINTAHVQQAGLMQEARQQQKQLQRKLQPADCSGSCTGRLQGGSTHMPCCTWCLHRRNCSQCVLTHWHAPRHALVLSLSVGCRLQTSGPVG